MEDRDACRQRRLPHRWQHVSRFYQSDDQFAIAKSGEQRKGADMVRGTGDLTVDVRACNVHAAKQNHLPGLEPTRERGAWRNSPSEPLRRMLPPSCG